MSVEVHVEGAVEKGRFAEFLKAAEKWRAWRRERGWREPRLLCGLSGAMNSVRLVFHYDDLGEYEREESRASRDPEYGKVASAMPFEGAIVYNIFQVEEGRGQGRRAPVEKSAPARHVLTIFATTDLERSVRFYREAFGWPARVEAPVYVELELPDGRGFGVYQRDSWAKNVGRAPIEAPPGEVTATEIYLHCDDLDAAIAHLERAGAQKLSERAPRDWGDEAAYYADPDGNVLVVARPMG